MNKTQEFINKAKLIHGDRYNYSNVIYTKSKNKVIIICKEHGEFEILPSNFIKGQNCNICSNRKKLTNEEFIEKSINTHGKKYDYSKINYQGMHKKIIIICKEHGEFNQTPSEHLNKKRGCFKCLGTVCDLNSFIEKSKKTHGEKYDYSKVIYSGYNKKAIIICKIHGEFQQTLGDHYQNGSGCPKCGVIKNSNANRGNKNDFIEKAILIHGQKYDYSKVKYISHNKKVIIICKIHGQFNQSVGSHLSGSGCNQCGIELSAIKTRLTNEDFIKKANKIHINKYKYSNINYTGWESNIIIICNIHGEFLQRAGSHLTGSGCQKCANNQFSKMQIQWLELLSKLYNINIQHSLNIGEFKINNTRYRADGYCKETNTIYEFHGDFWHGNPKIYLQNDINRCSKKTYEELYKNTLEKEQKIKDLGYNLVVMWESDWNKINKSISILQKKFRTCKDLNLHASLV